MQYAPTRTIQSLPGIGDNKYVFIRYLFRIGSGVLHTPQHVPRLPIIRPHAEAFGGRMRYALTLTDEKWTRIGWHVSLGI